MEYPNTPPAVPTRLEKANPVNRTPGNASSAIFGDRRTKSRKGISRPPPKRIKAALVVTSDASNSRFATMGAKSACPAIPSAIATTNDGSAKLRVR